MTDRPDEVHPAPTEDRPERPDEKPLRGADAIPADAVNGPDPDPSKPTRGTGWSRKQDEADPPPADI
jgi:hypothetical protein